MDSILDLAIKGGLGITATIFLGLFIREQNRHDETRKKYAEYERDRQAKYREVERERLALERDRVDADRDQTKVLSEIAVWLSVIRRHGDG